MFKYVYLHRKYYKWLNFTHLHLNTLAKAEIQRIQKHNILKTIQIYDCSCITLKIMTTIFTLGVRAKLCDCLHRRHEICFVYHIRSVVDENECEIRC